MNASDKQFKSILHDSDKKNSSLIVHVLLFVLTCASTMMAGSAWAGKNPIEITNWIFGWTYASLLMLFLLTHEFGHYFAAKYHGVDASLPYFIPLPIPFVSIFGTLGAYIKTRAPIPNRKALFDIGASGPLAGFVICFAIFVYGLMNLPTIDFLYSIHPDYKELGIMYPDWGMYFGDMLLFKGLTSLLVAPGTYIPPLNEIYHYPFLCVGWFGMFVTSLNLLPLGQLDGGHIAYAMFGNKQRVIAKIAWYGMIFLGFGSFLGWFYEQIVVESPNQIYTILQDIFLPTLLGIKVHADWVYSGWSGWLFWAFFTRFFIRLEHPPVQGDDIGIMRHVLGWITFIIFITTFA
ncbi:MAG: site-2 protease family protein, partial [bacterium]